MGLRRNNKGIALISVYVVMLIIVTLSIFLYNRMVQKFQLTQRDVLSTQALYDAEKGISHAYFELIKSSFVWPTQNPTQNTLCQIDANGYYVPINSSVGNFKVKVFSDPDNPNIVIIRSLGSSGQLQRALEYRASKRGIYDFYFYTPYNLNLAGLVSSGWIIDAGGGGIHANGDIQFSQQLIVKDCFELSTPQNIYYGPGRQYVRPAYIDDLDGPRDGMAPVPTLYKRDPKLGDISPGGVNLWADATGGPWGYYEHSGGSTYWSWKSDDASKAGSGWPPNVFKDTDTHFPGDSHSYNKVWVNSATGSTTSGPFDVQLNPYNVWIKPYKLDKTTGQELTTKYTEIPAKLDQPWSWDKYLGNAPSGEETLTLYTRGLEESGEETENIVLGGADDHWQLKKTGAAWNVYHSNNPNNPSYSQILKNPNYWKNIYGGNGWQADIINADLGDSHYGNDRENIDVNFLNSLQQEDAWKDFLESADTGLSGGLTDIIMDGNTGGEYLEPPSFSESYWRKAKNSGLYVGIPGESDTPPTAGVTDTTLIEKGIDAAVAQLNNNPTGTTVAKKVFAVSAYSGEKDCFLDIDVGKMSDAEVAPTNGIIYSRVPIRLSNAAVLPQNVGGFTVICEKRIYLKGDYNYKYDSSGTSDSRAQWVKAALVSRIGVTTVSNNYTDPQYLPALTDYLNYPYLNVASVGKDYQEVKLGTAGNYWVNGDSLAVDKDGDGIPDYYPQISIENQKTLKAKIATKDTNYRNTFLALGNDPNASADYIDPVGNDTVTGWGRMVQPANRNYYYNSLIATYYSPTQPSVDENWSDRSRTLKGSFIQLDTKDMAQDGFTAPSSEATPSLYTRNRNAPDSVAYYLGTSAPNAGTSYDKEFHTAPRSPADIFFGSTEPVWREISVQDFNQSLTTLK